MDLVKLVVSILAFTFGFQLWGRVVDKADLFFMEKLSSKTYNFITCSISIIFCIVVLSLIFFY